jgi:LmbE family N-acetylglucosaminyl deacetylase
VWYNRCVDWIYLSPHFDDVAFSCGGLVWEQVHKGESVSIWTICAGFPGDAQLSPFAASLHERWGTGERVTQVRRTEDAEACAELGATFRHMDIPDCIYRRSIRDGSPLYPTREAIFGPLRSEEQELVARLAGDLSALIPVGANVVCPLGLGGHVDHQLVRTAAESLARPLSYYADYPYVLQEKPEKMAERAGLLSRYFQISEAGLAAWEQAVLAHASQISSFWADEDATRKSIREYVSQLRGGQLWQPGQMNRRHEDEAALGGDRKT